MRTTWLLCTIVISLNRGLARREPAPDEYDTQILTGFRAYASRDAGTNVFHHQVVQTIKWSNLTVVVENGFYYHRRRLNCQRSTS
jgi:hypothetical protein